MKNTCTAILTILLLSSVFVLTGCESDSIQNGNNMLQGEISSEKTPETYTNGTISITLEPDKYTVEVDSEHYKPSLRISKSDDEYISVQKLENGSEKITWSENGSYTEEMLKSEFQDYVLGLVSFTEIEREMIGDKIAYKTETTLNSIRCNIYRIMTASNNVYKIIVSGPNFKDTAESSAILSSLELQ